MLPAFLKRRGDFFLPLGKVSFCTIFMYYSLLSLCISLEMSIFVVR